MTDSKAPESVAALHRRRFLKAMAAAGGASIAAPQSARAQNATPPRDSTPMPTAATQAKEREHPPEVEKLTTEKTGSDFMVDVCKTLDLDYIASCPGSTFRGFQGSFTHYRQNKKADRAPVPAGESVGRHGAWLRQGGRKADGGDRARHRRHPARGNG